MFMTTQNGITEAEDWLLKCSLGYAGGFDEALFSAFARADGVNIKKLAKGFPDYYVSFTLYRNEPGYFEALQKRAGITNE